MRYTAGELPDRFKFLCLAQRRFSILMVGHFGVQSAIGVVQVNSQPHRFRDDAAEVFARERKRPSEHNNHRPERGVGRSASDNKAHSHRQCRRPQEREKGR